MKTLFEQYFYFRRAERQAAWILLSCCFVGIGLPQIYENLQTPEAPPNFDAFHYAIAQIEAKEDSIHKPSPELASSNELAQPSIQLFPFNPNQATREELIQLGLSPKCAQTLLNFRKKGGRFFAKADLKKIYGLPDSTYQSLLPYIQIPSKSKKQPFIKKNRVIVIDINQATAEEWQQLRGIGPYFAKRILRFRESLGGFTSIDQVADTYHLPDSTFVQIRPKLQLSPIFRKLQINHLDYLDLVKHPYLNKKQVTTIIAYREAHGPFQSIDDLKKALLPFSINWEKLQPYLDFNNP